MSKGVQRLAVGQVVDPYAKAANYLTSRLDDSRNRRDADEREAENKRRFALSRQDRADDKTEDTRRFGLNQDRLNAATEKEQLRFDNARKSEEAGIAAVRDLSTRVWKEEDHPEEVRKEINRVRSAWNAEKSANTNFLSSGGNKERLGEALEAYRSGLDEKTLGESGVNDLVAERRVRLEALTRDLSLLDPKERADRIAQSQADLFSSRESELQNRIASGSNLTARQKTAAVLGSAKGITRSKDLDYVRNSVLQLSGSRTAESLRAAEAKEVATENSIAAKNYNSKIAGANRYNAKGNKNKPDKGGYGEILKILETKGGYGSLDSGKVTNFVEDALEAGVDMKTAALAIHLGTTGTEGTFFDKGFPSPDSDEYIKLLASARKIQRSSDGSGTFKPIDTSQFERPEVRGVRSIGELQKRDFTRNTKLDRTQLTASPESMKAIRDWRTKTRNLLTPTTPEIAGSGTVAEGNTGNRIEDIIANKTTTAYNRATGGTKISDATSSLKDSVEGGIFTTTIRPALLRYVSNQVDERRSIANAIGNGTRSVLDTAKNASVNGTLGAVHSGREDRLSKQLQLAKNNTEAEAILEEMKKNDEEYNRKAGKKLTESQYIRLTRT